MSSDRSMFSSAASRGKPQPVRSAGNTHSSHKEQKESKMFNNGLSSSRGISLAAAALAAAGLTMLAAGTAQANLILNGDFSANASSYTTSPGYSAAPYQTSPYGPTDWTVNAGGSGSSAAMGVNGPGTGFYGSASYEPFAPTSAAGVGDFAFIQTQTNNLSQTVATAAGQAYTLSYAGAQRAILAGNDTGNDVLDVIIMDATNGVQIITQTPSILPTAFTNFTLKFTAASASTEVEFLNNSSNPTSGTVDVSNVSLVAVPEPATLSLLALGGLGLLLASRKRKVRV